MAGLEPFPNRDIFVKNNSRKKTELGRSREVSPIDQRCSGQQRFRPTAPFTLERWSLVKSKGRQQLKSDSSVVFRAISPEKTVFKVKILLTAKKSPQNNGIFSLHARITVSER
ncbi:hypothetical protein M0802_012781 [Mischocyttarus mexicanus]|nr:hypothetical protein M0802_012781 [Mischocyttarus mexicanus]